MIVTKKHLPRRTFLRGLGTTLSLPLLDSMVPAFAATSKTAAKPTVRMGFVYVPNGIIMDRWTPAAEGTAFEFTPTMKSLEPFRDHLNVLTRAGTGERARAGRRRRRSCARGRHLAHRRASQEDRRR